MPFLLVSLLRDQINLYKVATLWKIFCQSLTMYLWSQDTDRGLATPDFELPIHIFSCFKNMHGIRRSQSPGIKLWSHKNLLILWQNVSYYKHSYIFISRTHSKMAISSDNLKLYEILQFTRNLLDEE